MFHDLKSYVGRSAVYIESSQACVTTVETAQSSADRMAAAFRLVPGAFMCSLRFFRTSCDDPIETVLDEAPFGNEWQVEASETEFFLEDELWQASFLWGGGFRVFFQPSFVGRFLKADVAWLDEFYADEDADEIDG